VTPLLALVAGLSMGLASTPHCAVMCGPLAALACGTRGSPLAGAARYQLGRTATYTLVAGTAGYGGAALGASLREAWVARGLSAALAVAMVAFAWRLWRRAAATSKPRVDRGLIALRGQPRPVNDGERRGPWLALVMGVGSGFLPCGALALMLIAAAGTAAPLAGALLGFGFVTATGLGLAGTGGIARWLVGVSKPGSLRLVSVLMVLGAGLFLVRAWPVDAGECPHHPGMRLH
jgi:uncharacterized protein